MDDFHLLSFVKTPIMFRMVSSPYNMYAYVLGLVSTTSKSSLTYFKTYAQVCSRFRSFNVRVIYRYFRSVKGAFKVSLCVSFFISSCLPTIISSRMFVAYVLRTYNGRNVYRFFSRLFTRVTSRFIPTIPSREQDLYRYIGCEIKCFFFDTRVRLYSNYGYTYRRRSCGFYFRNARNSFRVIFVFYKNGDDF